MRRCGNCKGLVDEPVPHCRMVPPTTTSIDGTRSSFPPVNINWVCGAHKYSMKRIAHGVWVFATGGVAGDDSDHAAVG